MMKRIFFIIGVLALIGISSTAYAQYFGFQNFFRNHADDNKFLRAGFIADHGHCHACGRCDSPEASA